ncbi:MAG: hypothetical protein R2877_06525 [Bdellovibrionota bacterium]
MNTSEVSNIRVGENSGNIRVVLDLKSKAIPEYRVDNIDGKITITVPGPQAVVAQMEPVAEPTPPESFAEAVPMAEEAPAETAPAESFSKAVRCECRYDGTTCKQ